MTRYYEAWECFPENPNMPWVKIGSCHAENIMLAEDMLSGYPNHDGKIIILTD